MGRRPKVSLAVLLALIVSPPLFARNGGGGGHGAGGGHGGSHAGGHFGGGVSSGHSFGHSIGHSLGHLFGHRSGEHSSRAGKNVAIHDHSPARRVPVVFIVRPARRRMLPQNQLINSGFCDSFRFSWRSFLFPGEFDCFGNAFIDDPFFYGGSFGTHFWSDSFASSGVSAGPLGPSGSVLTTSPDQPGSAAPLLLNFEDPVALLQLLDGSMYGLTRYWVEGMSLHYVTTYGGENSVPLEQIDFAKTSELNANRGTRFDLTGSLRNP
jgi:hypothetical protein